MMKDSEEEEDEVDDRSIFEIGGAQKKKQVMMELFLQIVPRMKSLSNALICEPLRTISE